MAEAIAKAGTASTPNRALAVLRSPMLGPIPVWGVGLGVGLISGVAGFLALRYWRR